MKKVILIAISFLYLHSNYGQDTINWLKDIEVFDEGLRKTHVDLFHTITEKEFDKLIVDLKKDASNLDTLTFNYRLLEIVSSIGDMHTRATVKHHHALPFHIFLFEEGFFIRAVDSSYEELLADQILAINEVPIQEVYNRLKRLTSADNYIGYMTNSLDLMTIPEILTYLEVIPGSNQSISITFAKQGKINIHPSDKIVSEDKMIHVFQKRNNPVPIYISSLFSGAYHYQYLSKNGIFYIQLNTIRDLSGDMSFEDLFDKIITSIDSLQPNKVVLDLRWNGGGNDPVYRNALPKFISSLICNDLNNPDKFFTIIGRYTASAAQHLVNDLEYLTNTTFIGEPTKQNVHFFSDSRWFILPDSKIRVSAAAGWIQNFVPKGIEDRTVFKPDVHIPLSFQSFEQNQDPVLSFIEDN